MKIFNVTININSNNNSNNTNCHTTNVSGSKPPNKHPHNKILLLIILGFILIIFFCLQNSDNLIGIPDLFNIFTTIYLEKIFDYFL